MFSLQGIIFLHASQKLKNIFADDDDLKMQQQPFGKQNKFTEIERFLEKNANKWLQISLTASFFVYFVVVSSNLHLIFSKLLQNVERQTLKV